jgi:hypothetical protein
MLDEVSEILTDLTKYINSFSYKTRREDIVWEAYAWWNGNIKMNLNKYGLEVWLDSFGPG